jgi:ATP-dependent Clp protease ATP-binding subunit ClpC
MFELFTEKATKVVALAQDEAIEIGYRSVGSEDFLLGLIREGNSWFPFFRKPGLVAQALRSEGLRLKDVRRAAKQFRRRDEKAGSVEFQPVGDTYSKVTHLEFTEDAKKLMLASKGCATELGHKQIGTAHLLIGLLSQDDCNGVKVLKTLRVDCDHLREIVRDRLITREDPD